MKQIRNIAGVVLAIAAVLFGYNEVRDGNASSGQTTQPSTAQVPASSRGATESRGAAAADRILQAFDNGESDLWIEANGTVQRVLSDDSEGSRHQRFIVRLPNDHTILIAHNIDLAQRVPLAMGDPVSFYGEYEWNDRGGVVHWTHHDPQNRRDGGWVRHKGTTYR